MSIHSGERAKKTGEIQCSSCYIKIHVMQGEKIPECPNCGKNIYNGRSKYGNRFNSNKTTVKRSF